MTPAEPTDTVGLQLGIDSFIKLAADIVSEVNKQDIIRLDLQTIRHQKNKLNDLYQDTVDGIDSWARVEAANLRSDLVARGLANTTVLEGQLTALDKKASEDKAKAAQEYKSSLEKLDIKEQQVMVRNRGWRGKLVAFIQSIRNSPESMD